MLGARNSGHVESLDQAMRTVHFTTCNPKLHVGCEALIFRGGQARAVTIAVWVSPSEGRMPSRLQQRVSAEVY